MTPKVMRKRFVGIKAGIIVPIRIITPDITRSYREVGGAICEINAAPGFRMHVAPTEGTPRDVAGPVMDMLFPDDTPRRIPIASVTGTNGKTTTARVLSKALNCETGSTANPCSNCVSCQEISAANSLDVQEIDAASNTGVDNIRDLRENARYATARDRFKIFIIDEVHMLSNAAFNALLKILEEPPEHVKFILATTERHRIPMTITSRCQEFNFKPIPFTAILELLQKICRKEELEISDYSLRAVVSTAEGSMRDAQSLLDQITAMSGTKVLDDDVRALLGVVDDELISAMIDILLRRDMKALLQRFQEPINAGVDPQNLCRRMIRYIRNLLVCKVAGWDDHLLQLPDTDREILLKQAKELTEPDLIRFYDVLSQTQNELRWHANPYLHLEMTFMKLIELARLPTLERVIERLESGSVRAKTEEIPPEKIQELFEKPSKEAVPEETSEESKPASEGSLHSQLIAAVQKESIPLSVSLQQARATNASEEKLVIVFPDSEKFHAQLVQSEENQTRLVDLCYKITGSRLQIEVQLEASGTEDSPPEDPMEDPKVKAFIERFPGKVIVERKPEE